MLRAFGYLLAFLFPPVVLGFSFLFMMSTQNMIQDKPEPLASASEADLASPTLDSTKPTALILLSSQGTQVTDLMGPYQVLVESGLINVATVAPERKLVPLTGRVSVYPDFSFKDAPEAQLIVVPAVVDSQDSQLIDWVRLRGRQAKLVLGVCEGARLLAAAGLLDDKHATTHFMAFEDMRKSYPRTVFEEATRFVQDGNIITTAGVTASIDGARHAITVLKGKPKVAAVRANDLRQMSGRDFFHLFLNGGFDWNRLNTGALLYPGVSEMGLAAMLDVFPRSMNARTLTLSEKRGIVRTQNGLRLVATVGFENAPKLDLLVIPPGSAAEPPARSAEVDRFLRDREQTVKSLFHIPSARIYEETLQLVSEVLSPADAAFAAKMIEQPWPMSDRSRTLPWDLIARAAGLGLMGVVIARWLEKRLAKKKSPQA